MSVFLSSPLLAVAVTLGGAGSYQFLTNSPAYPIRGEVSANGYIRGESAAFLAEAARERIFVADFINFSGGTRWSYEHPQHDKSFYQGEFPRIVPLSRSANGDPDDIDDARGCVVMSTNITDVSGIFKKDFVWSGLRSSDNILVLYNFHGGTETNALPPYSSEWVGAYANMFASGRPTFSRSFDYVDFLANSTAARWLPIRGSEIGHILDDFHNNNGLAFDHQYFGKAKTLFKETFERTSFSPGNFSNTYVPQDPDNPDKPYGYIGPPKWEKEFVASNIVYYSAQSNYTNSNDILTWRDSYQVRRTAHWGWTGSNLVSKVEGFSYESAEAYTQPTSDGAPVITFDYVLKDHMGDLAVYGIFNAREIEQIYSISNGNPKRANLTFKVNRDAWLMKKLTATKVDASPLNGVMYEISMSWPSLAMSILQALGDDPPSVHDNEIRQLVKAPTEVPKGPYAYYNPSNSLAEVSAEVSLRRNYEIRLTRFVGAAKITYNARKSLGN